MGKTYLLSINGKNEGPFKESELTGKFLRGEIEGTAQVCAVGGNAWESLSDSLRRSAARKQLVLIILGGVFFWIGVWGGFKFAAMFDGKKLAELEIAKLEAPAFLQEAGETIAENARVLRLSTAQIEQNIATFVRSVKDDKAKWIGIRDGISSKRLAYGAGGGLAIALGTAMFIIGLRTKAVSRPRLPGVTPALPTPRPPSPSSLAASNAGVSAPTAPSPAKPQSASPAPRANQPSPPSVPPPTPKPATPKEPKALCPACQQKVAFPKQMAGHQIACPACGAMMALDDCSDMVA